MAADNDQGVYWNEEGGARWVANIERVERMLTGFADAVIADLAPRDGERVLDIGCGGGLTSAAIAEAVGEQGSVLGVDVSRVILDVARERFAGRPNLQFELSDAATHPFTPAGFDAITSRFGVMFFHDPDAAFTNIRRAARDGARMSFICWRTLDENHWMSVPARAAFSVLTPPEKPDPEAPGPFSFASEARVRRILGNAGFTDIALGPWDQKVCLGSVDEALDWLTSMGPAATPIAEAEATQAAAAVAAMREALAANATDAGVLLDGAAWLVSARAG